MRGAKKKHVKKGHGLVDFESDTLDQCSAIGLMRKISEKVMGGVGGGAEDRHLTAGDELSTLKVIFLSCNSLPAIIYLALTPVRSQNLYKFLKVTDVWWAYLSKKFPIPPKIPFLNLSPQSYSDRSHCLYFASLLKK